MKRLVVLGVLLSMHLSSFADSRQQIISRIQPIGRVQIEGLAVISSKPIKKNIVAKDDKKATKIGLSVYQQYCIACHGTGLLGAPKVHDQVDWGKRYAKGIETLVSHVSTGYNAMPPKGTCFSCQDEDLKAAIQYMMSK